MTFDDDAYPSPGHEDQGVRGLNEDQKRRVGNYFSENYEQGRRLEVPDLEDGEGWLEWMEGRLIDVGFYDEHGLRAHEAVEEAPPRIHLRADSTKEESEETGIDGGSIGPSHIEFKVWLQHKIEQVRLGTASTRFLANENENIEYAEYTKTWEKLTKEIEALFERRIVQEDDLIDGRHLKLMRKIIGRSEPDIKCEQYDPAFHRQNQTLNFGGHQQMLPSLWQHRREMLQRENLVTRISREIARSLFSVSMTGYPTPREVFEQVGKENEGQTLLDFAKENGVHVTGREVRDAIDEKFVRNGIFNRNLYKFDRNKMMLSAKEYELRTKIRLCTQKLVKGGIDPPPKWYWVNQSLPGIKLLPELGGRIENIIHDSKDRVLEISGDPLDSARLKDRDPLIGLSDQEEEDLTSIVNGGFGNTKGNKGKTSDELTVQNARKLTTCIVNFVLLEHGLLSYRKMSREEYREHFLEGDESKEKSRGDKQWPNLLLFTMKLKKMIGKSRYQDFKASRENAIYRWMRGDRDRWMYSPPERHRVGEEGNIAGGFLEQKNRKIATGSNMSEYDRFEVPMRGSDGEVVKDDDGEARKVSSRRCNPNAVIIQALNALQETQWEVNLDFLSKVFDIELDNGEILTGGLSGKRDRINRIAPKASFSAPFDQGDHETQVFQRIEGERKKTLEYVRRIIEHNANVFWQSWACDFRGRLLPRCTLLSPHGNDLQKALIRFKHWKPLGKDKDDATGFGWLQVYVHNLIEGSESDLWRDGPAKKKQTFEERREWVNENAGALREIASRPTEHLKTLGLDAPRYGRRDDFQRLAALIELDRVLTKFESNGNDWSKVTSGLPIHLDASCNGYQHVSTLLRHRGLAELVNVIPSARPQDLYKTVADRARRHHSAEVRAIFERTLGNSDLIEEALGRVFSRSVAKIPTMTRVYGAKDLFKGISGRNGRGRPLLSHLLPRVRTEKEEADMSKIPEKFILAKWEFEENPLEYNKRHYTKHARKPVPKSNLQGLLRKHGLPFSGNKDTLVERLAAAGVKVKLDKPSPALAKKWERLLEEDKPIDLWAPGSGLHLAIIQHEILGEYFRYSKDFPASWGPHWKEQPALTKATVAAFSAAIEEVTGGAYDKLEGALDEISQGCNGLYPGVRWHVLPGSTEDEGGTFEVNNYYIKHYTSKDSSGGWPSYPETSYSALLPEWYAADNKKEGRLERQKKNGTAWQGASPAKSKKRIMCRLGHQFESNKSMPANLKRTLGQPYNRGRVERVLEWAEENHGGNRATKRLIAECSPLLDHVKYSIPRYKEKEKERINKKKFGTSIAPNFVHSLDAYHMRATINRMSDEVGHLSFWAVHDSFGTHARDIDRLREVVLGVFREMHLGGDLNLWLREMGETGGPKLRIGKKKHERFEKEWKESLFLIG